MNCGTVFNSLFGEALGGIELDGQLKSGLSFNFAANRTALESLLLQGGLALYCGQEMVFHIVASRSFINGTLRANNVLIYFVDFLSLPFIRH